MDAVIFNDCERQFINAIRSVNKFLDKPLMIEVYAKEKGGLKDNLKIIITNSLAVGVIVVVAQSFFQAQIPQRLAHSEETKNRLENILMIKDAIKSSNLTAEEYEYIAGNDKDLKKMKSNFFKSAKLDDTLSQIEIETATQVNDKPVFDKIIVPYDKFDDFIIIDNDEEEHEAEVDDKAKIFIIAPILVKGIATHWRGYYGGMPIDFKVSDEVFLELIYSHEIKFGNGTYIDCKLITVTTTKIDTGKETITREVSEVRNWGDDNGFVRPIKRHKKDDNDYKQGYLFNDTR
jgi:hypothetical protein